MPRRVVPLSDLKVSKAKPSGKQYRLTDGDGLYLLVTLTGSKLWRFDYRFLGIRKTLAIGPYPEWSLSEARLKREESRKLVAHGVDPMETKKLTRQVIGATGTDSFEVIAREWHTTFKHTWVDKHAQQKLQRLESNVFPWIGNMSITEITAPDLLSVLRRITTRGAIDLAHRVRVTCSQVYQYAIATGRYDRNTAMDLRGALPSVQGGHHAAPTDPKQLGLILRSIEDYTGSLITKCALQLAPMLFVRPGELRHMEWAEIDFATSVWNIPAGKMKMRTAHLVPLPRQAVAILKELQPLTRHSRYAFPCLRSPLRPMSDNTVNAGLRRLGFTKEEVVGHGFRATARTILDEVLNVRPDFIEHQLAHAVRDPNGRAYNRTAHLDERKKMMQLWADYLEKIRCG